MIWFTLRYFDKDKTETSSGIVFDAKVRLSDYSYRSNWAVVSCRYGLFYATPCHYTNETTTNYKNSIVTIGDVALKRISPSTPILNSLTLKSRNLDPLLKK